MFAPFPTTTPKGFSVLGSEPTFDPDRHLALAQPDPESVLDLSDLGYASDVATACSSVAAAGPFRVLSEAGVADLMGIVKRLESEIVSGVGRIPRKLRGAAYRSRFVRDLANSPEVARHISEILGTRLSPHPMPHHLAHMNFAPEQRSQEVDRWHADIVGIDYVMMLTEPVGGGRFQFFKGTVEEARALLAADGALDPNRLETPTIQPGFAVAMQGNLVMHRATAMADAGERVSFVNAYVSDGADREDPNRAGKLFDLDPSDAIYTEWVRHKAWRTSQKLRRLVADVQFTDDRDALRHDLLDAIADVQVALDDLADPAGAGREPWDPARLPRQHSS